MADSAWEERRKARQRKKEGNKIHQRLEEPSNVTPLNPLFRQNSPKPTLIEQKDSSNSILSFVLLLFSTLAFIVAVYLGAPVLGREDWNFIYLAAGIGLGLIAALMVQIRWREGKRPSKYAKTSVFLSLILIASFIYGTSQTLVIDGRAYFVTSEEAQAYNYSLEVRRDYQKMAEYDNLLILDNAGAQARIDEYEVAIREMRSLNSKYNDRLSSLPSGNYENVTQSVSRAATLGAEALELKERLTTQADIATSNRLATTRSDFVELMLTIPNELINIGRVHYNFNISTSAIEGPTE